MEQALILTSVAFLGNKIIEGIKYMKNKDWNALVTLLAIHLSGVVVLLFAAATKVTKTLVVPGTSAAIGSLDKGSVAFLGLVITSLSSKLYDFQKAFDRSDTAKQPPLTGKITSPLVTVVTPVPPAA